MIYKYPTEHLFVLKLAQTLEGETIELGLAALITTAVLFSNKLDFDLDFLQECVKEIYEEVNRGR